MTCEVLVAKPRDFSNDCYDVAMAFIRHPCFRVNDPTDIPYQVNYLVFFAQIYSSGKLITEDFEAWIHGPVIPKLYFALKGAKLPHAIKELTPQAKYIVDCVMEDLQQYDKLELRSLAKNEMAYQLTRGDLAHDAPCTKIIPKDLLR